MTNTPRTRAEIQAEIENKVQRLESAAFAYGRATGAFEANPNEFTSKYSFEAECTLITRNAELFRALERAADLIPRAEHERALEEANTRTDKVVAHLDARDAIAYLVKEYDTDTGHQDTAEPRTYRHTLRRHYKVTVHRAGDAVAPKGVVEELRREATRIRKGQSSSHESHARWLDHIAAQITELQQTAVAPKGVVERLKAILCLLPVDCRYRGRALADQITELPEPSEWAREYIRAKQPHTLIGWMPDKRRDLAAALLESEARDDHA